MPDLMERLSEKYVEDAAGCWLWTAAVGGGGYGYLWAHGRVARAHRVAYELHVGPIPEGLDLDHLCRNRLCVNPEHLEPVTRSENLRRGLHGGGPIPKAECKRGHPFDAENTRITSTGKRRCRACHRLDKAKARSRA